MRKLVILVVLVATVVVLTYSTVWADDGSPNTQPLGLTSISPSWYGGMIVVVGKNTIIYANFQDQEILGKALETTKGQIPILLPREVRNWTLHKKIYYAAPLEVAGRVAVLPLGSAINSWRGIGWIPKEKVVPLDFYQEGQFEEEERNSQPTLYLCSH